MTQNYCMFTNTKKLIAIVLSSLMLMQVAFASSIATQPINDNGYDIVDIYDENRFIIQTPNKLCGVMDASGKEVISPIYEYIEVYQGFFIAGGNGKTNSEIYFDYNGNEIVRSSLAYRTHSKDGLFLSN